MLIRLKAFVEILNREELFFMPKSFPELEHVSVVSVLSRHTLSSLILQHDTIIYELVVQRSGVNKILKIYHKVLAVRSSVKNAFKLVAVAMEH